MQMGGMFSGSLSLVLSWIGCLESHEILLGASGLTRSDAEVVDVLSETNGTRLNLGCGLAKSRGVPIVRRVALVVIILGVLALLYKYIKLGIHIHITFE